MLCFDYAGENNLKVSDIMNLQNIETNWWTGLNYMAISSNNIYFAGGRELKEIIKFLSTPAIREKLKVNNCILLQVWSFPSHFQ